MTIWLPVDISEKLSRLAKGTDRSRSHLAATAIAAFVERELAIVEGIEQGLADVETGRVTSHDNVMAESEVMVRGLRNALIAGEKSGRPRPLDFKGLKARKRAERAVV